MDDKDKKTQQDQFIGKVYFSKYTIQRKLGEGSFGSIYAANFKEEEYALKFENRTKGQGLLEAEAYIMSYLKGPGIPFVKSYGYSQDYNILVMELLGKSLEDIFVAMPEKKMTIKCVCNIGYQMINILQYVHDKHIIHRDIKPDNFVLGLGDKANQLYLLDFGLAKKYRSSTTLNHYPMTNKKKLTGTARYASINALNGFEQSRRDDLEAVGYVLMYFLRGALPWQGLPVKNKEDRYVKIMEKKRDTSAQELCEGFPKEFEDYVTYTRNLAYEQDPNYDYLKELFVKVLRDQNQTIDYIYDWTPSELKSAAKEKDSLKNNLGSAHRTHDNESNPANGPQITVVNNYYHNVQNILIQSSEKEKEKEKEKEIEREREREREKDKDKQGISQDQDKQQQQRLNTKNSIVKDKENTNTNTNINYNAEVTNLNSKRNRESNIQLQKKGTNYSNNKNNRDNYDNNKVLTVNNETKNQRKTNPLSQNPNSKDDKDKDKDNNNIIVSKKEDNKCCIIV